MSKNWRNNLRFVIELTVLTISIWGIVLLAWVYSLGDRDINSFVERLSIRNFIIRLSRDPVEALFYEPCGKMLMSSCPRYNLGIEDWLYCQTHESACCALAGTRQCKI